MSPEELDSVAGDFLKAYFMRGQDVGQPAIPDVDMTNTTPPPLSSITFEDLTDMLARLEREYGYAPRRRYYLPFTPSQK